MINKLLVLICVLLVVLLGGLSVVAYKNKNKSAMVSTTPIMANQKVVYIPTVNPNPTKYIPKGIGDNDYIVKIDSLNVIDGNVFAKKGANITWKNNLTSAVTLVFSRGNESIEIKPGATLVKSFSDLGANDYFIKENPVATGRVSIQE